MTREELLALPNLSIAEITSFVHIHSKEGYVIANTPENMKDYLYTNCLYLNIEDEYEEEWRTLTEEENEANLRLQEEAIAADGEFTPFNEEEMAESGTTAENN